VSKRILLVIGGGIAAYKCLDLVRRLRERGIGVRSVLTKAGAEFVTPLSVGALSNERVFTDLFDLDDEREIGHIRLSRECDLIVVAPATADLLAKMANGHANDLATATLLATNRPVLVAPAMNPKMWNHPATQRNVAQLKIDGVSFIGPAQGEMAESGEAGVGRLSEPLEIVAKIEEILKQRGTAKPPPAKTKQPLAGQHVLVTSGPTHEPIDPVRFLANRSSGKQGYAIAVAAQALGARVTLISGPVSLPAPSFVEVVAVETAAEMLAAVEANLPADIAVFAAAVADWRVAEAAGQKLKKGAKKSPPKLELVENPDILRTVANLKKKRPALVIGFAAETETVIDHAQAKLKSKGCDWIVANDVSPDLGVMGGDRNTVHLVTATGIESWPEMTKSDVANVLMTRAAEQLAKTGTWV
jgi:phosphopantothenoylcysteine decarboxylase / phosphopantothenate---cysteine ligase